LEEKLRLSDFLLTILLVSFSIGVFGEAQVPSKGVVTAQHGLHFRTGPGAQFPIINTLPKGTEVRIVDFSGRWYKVRIAQQGGFCFARYIQVTERISANEDDASRIPHVALGETDPSRPALNAIAPRIIPQSN